MCQVPTPPRQLAVPAISSSAAAAVSCHCMAGQMVPWDLWQCLNHCSPASRAHNRTPTAGGQQWVGQRRALVNGHLAWAERRRLAPAEQRPAGSGRGGGAGYKTGPGRSRAGYAACSRRGAGQAAPAGEAATAAHIIADLVPGKCGSRLGRCEGAALQIAGDLLQVPRTARHGSLQAAEGSALASGLTWQTGLEGLPAQCPPDEFKHKHPTHSLTCLWLQGCQWLQRAQAPSLDCGATDALPQAVRASPEASLASTTAAGAEAPKHKHPHLHKIGQKAHIVRKDPQDPDESKFHEKELKGKKGVVVSATGAVV